MIRPLITIAGLVTLIQAILLNGGDPKDLLTTETLVRRHGYPFENHRVLTEDGYILSIHRIPQSTSASTSKSHPVAFLMHCLMCSSSDWVVVGPGNALPYILHDHGYDVWLGNIRGNTYSRNHVKYTPEEDRFWDFSLHEIGVYDLPAMTDYIRNFTRADQLSYFGFSQGTTVFLILNSMKPEYNKFFKSASLLAPVAFLGSSPNVYLKIFGFLLGEPNSLSNLIANKELRLSKELMSLIGELLCTDKTSYRVLCKNSIFLITGFNEDTVDKTIIPDVMASSPAGTSTNVLLHYVQEKRSGLFQQFDRGFLGNVEAYGTAKPPMYPLEKISVPIFLYYGLSDSFATKKDVLRLRKRLSSVEGLFENPIPNFDHLAHIYTANIWEKLYKFVMKDLASIK